MANQLRIIGGTHKRRSVSFVSANGLRPTPDRLRETIFNWLMYDLQDARVLDVCAGSGALSWEALSRGAAHCILIEPHKKQFQQLKLAANQLGFASQTTLINQTAQQGLKRVSEPCDIIFLDPPYSLNLWAELLSQLRSQGLIAPHTLIYIEADKAHADLNFPFALDAVKHKKVGQIFAGLYQLPSMSH